MSTRTATPPAPGFGSVGVQYIDAFFRPVEVKDERVTRLHNWAF